MAILVLRLEFIIIFFKLYALNIMLNLNKESTKEQLESATSGHYLSKMHILRDYQEPTRVECGMLDIIVVFL